ncbi:hypothetical protein MMC26_006389 [Xylographa opegraphella]|nr:hypothetical protein [Xylographa opegraphella]
MSDTIPSHGDDFGIAIIVCGWLFQVIAAVAVALRVWARHLKKQKLVLNDHLAFAALVATILLNIGSTWAVVDAGQGQHASDLSGEQVTEYAKIFGQIRWFRICSYTLLTMSVLYAIAVILEIFLLCRPLSSLWDPSIKGACGSEKAAYLGVGITNLIIDCFIIILPLPVLWNLRLKVSKKIALSFVFSLGTLIIIITGLRIQALSEVDPKDPTYTTGHIGVYSVLEPTLGLINACLPVLQPVINHLSNGTKWTRGLSAFSKGSEGHSRFGHNRPFDKLANENDTLPLRDVETGNLPSTTVYTGSGSTHSDMGDVKLEEPGHIRVRQEISVHGY